MTLGKLKRPKPNSELEMTQPDVTAFPLYRSVYSFSFSSVAKHTEACLYSPDNTVQNPRSLLSGQFQCLKEPPSFGVSITTGAGALALLVLFLHMDTRLCKGSLSSFSLQTTNVSCGEYLKLALHCMTFIPILLLPTETVHI